MTVSPTTASMTLGSPTLEPVSGFEVPETGREAVTMGPRTLAWIAALTLSWAPPEPGEMDSNAKVARLEKGAPATTVLARLNP